MGPERKTRGRAAFCCAGVLAALAAAMVAQRCFAVSGPPPLPAAPAAQRQQPPSCGHGAGGALCAGGAGQLAAAGAPPLAVGGPAAFAGGARQTETREVGVQMQNGKKGRADSSPGWSNYKGFRIHSEMARMATRKGRKMTKRKIMRGQKTNLFPGNYESHKFARIQKMPTSRKR
ncbi:unnamed protein product [Prorocentrum cordatum]|uniref:50S ribosomal protein L35 n=1 Tax=Prorocentrum cordatum TaxID=2364126 RepID=A0ABN9T2G3_9DINO|nr:unnamed protein product [Polarella glacialis]